MALAVFPVIGCGGGGGGGEKDPPPTVTLSANATAIPSGGVVVLTWSSTNAEECVGTDGSGESETLATTGRVTLTLTQNTTFTIRCTGEGGSATQSRTVTIAQAPTLAFSADDLLVSTGGSTTLTWSSTDATTCGASAGWTGTRSPSGTAQTPVLTQSTTFTIACTGAGGNVSKSVTVLVAKAVPVVTLTAMESSIPLGQYAELRWSTSDPALCTASGSWAGSRPQTGREFVGPLTAPLSFRLECANGFGSASAMAAVTVDNSVTIESVTFLAHQEGPHFSGLGPTVGDPLVGPGYALIGLQGPVASVDFFLVGLDDREIAALQLTREGVSRERHSFYRGPITVAQTQFRVSARGLRPDGSSFVVESRDLFEGTTIEVAFLPIEFEPRRGQTGQLRLRIKNLGDPGVVDVVCVGGTAVAIIPAVSNVPVAAAATAVLDLRLAVATNIPARRSRPTITCNAVMTNAAGDGASSTARLILPISDVFGGD